MAQKTIETGASANSGGGDPLRDAFIKVNDNFTEVYAKLTALEDGSITTSITGDVVGSVFADDSSVMVDAVNNKMYAETVTTLAVFGNPTLSVNADTIALDAQAGNLVLQTVDTITNNFGNTWEVQGPAASMVLNDDGVLPSEFSVNIDVVDFGTGNTIDMQNCSLLLNGTTFTDEPWISLADLKTVVAASADFTDFQTRIAAL